MPAPRDAPAERLCPRCGYDQSGPVATWSDSCPLVGRCTECGLEFRWGEVLNAVLTVPRWSFEHAEVSRFGRLLATAVRALTPWRLYGALRMEHRIVTRRVLLYAALCLLINHLLLALAGLAVLKTLLVATWSDILRNPHSRLWPLRTVLLPYLPTASDPDAYRWSGIYWVWFVCLWVFLTPLAFLLLRQTMRKVRVRPAHILRAAAYSLTALPLLAGGLGSLRLMVYAAAFARGPFVLPGPMMFILRGGWLFVPFTAVWLVVYWWIVADRYLRLPHARWVVMLLVLMAFLASFTLVLLTGTGLQHETSSFISWLTGGPQYW